MAAYSEIILEQNADFSTTITIEDDQGDIMNLMNYSAASQMRKSHYSSSYTSFNVSLSNDETGQLIISMNSANTANLDPGRYYYDILITSPTNQKTRVAEGIATVTPGVTR